MPHKYFSIDGLATFVHHVGATTLPETPPDTRQGEVVLCLHGSGRHGGDFEALLPLLGAKHSPIAFDQPGHGRSGSLDSLGSIDRMTSFTGALRDKLGLGSDRPLVLLGHSLGAAVALQLALDAPDSVRGLVIVSGGAGFDLSDELMDNMRLVTEGKRRRDFDASVFSKQTEPDVMRRAFMAGMKTDPRATYGDLLGCRDWRPSDDALAGIACPVLVVHGADEQAPVVAQADRLVELLPKARKAVVDGAGQMILYEQPEALADEVLGFLETLS